MTAKVKNILDLILNLILILSTVAAIGGYFVSGPDILGSVGTECFCFFTTDSNILAAVAAFILLIGNIRRLCKPETKTPAWARLFKFVSTTAVAITLLTVLFFLAPMGSLRGGWRMFFFFFQGNVFVLHFSTPVLAIVSLLLEREEPIGVKALWWALLPTVIYSLVYLVMVVWVKSWVDWYGFTFGGKLYLIPVSMLGMYLFTFGVAALLRKIGNPKKPSTAAK